MTTTVKRGYGWKGPSKPDIRDLIYEVPEGVVLPSSVDLRQQFTFAPYDQGQLGSCVSNATAGFVEYLQLKEGIPSFMPSRLYIYFNGRWREGTIGQDSGESVRDGVKSVNSLGVCPESEWPYNISQFTLQPSMQCYADARSTRAVQYSRVQQSLTQIQTCLASGFPVIFGCSVYQSFESTAVETTGIVPMPSQNEQLLGGHCMLLVGYDTSKDWFIVRNSWGTGFGDGGYLYMPLEYITNPNLTSDIWTIRLVS
jgi:C1A family cysteine protease